MAISPAHRPDDNAGSGNVSGTDASHAWSGTPNHDGDPTNMDGQYPPGSWGNALFGGPLPDGTGAPGTQGVRTDASMDSTNEPGQTVDGLTGVSDHDIVSSGAPGTATRVPGPGDEGGSTAITFTRPGAYLSGTNQSETMRDDLSGPTDSTQANDQGYATGGPQLPGIKGNEPQPGQGHRYQPGGGRVLRGGRDVRP